MNTSTFNGEMSGSQISPKKMKRLLLVLNPEKKSSRVIRRAVALGLISFVSILLTAVMELAPAYAAIFVAIIAGLDKLKREVEVLDKLY